MFEALWFLGALWLLVPLAFEALWLSVSFGVWSRGLLKPLGIYSHWFLVALWLSEPLDFEALWLSAFFEALVNL